MYLCKFIFYCTRRAAYCYNIIYYYYFLDEIFPELVIILVFLYIQVIFITLTIVFNVYIRPFMHNIIIIMASAIYISSIYMLLYIIISTYSCYINCI